MCFIINFVQLFQEELIKSSGVDSVSAPVKYLLQCLDSLTNMLKSLAFARFSKNAHYGSQLSPNNRKFLEPIPISGSKNVPISNIG